MDDLNQKGFFIGIGIALGIIFLTWIMLKHYKDVRVCTNTIKETFLLVWEFFWVLCCPHIFCSDRPNFAARNSLGCGGVLLFPSLPPLFPHRLRSLFHFIGRQRENQVVPPGLPLPQGLQVTQVPVVGGEQVVQQPQFSVAAVL